MKSETCLESKSPGSAPALAGVSSALAALASTAADAQVIVNNTEHTLQDFAVVFGWDPLADSSYANSSGGGADPLIFYGCGGFMYYASGGDGVGYDTVQFGGSVAPGSNIADVDTWTSPVAAGAGYIASAGEVGNTLPDGSDLFIAFRFRQTDETLYNHGFAHFIVNSPDDSFQTLATMKGFAWQSTLGEGLTVNAIPEASTVSLLGVAGLFLWWMRRRFHRVRT